jgi:drug/metabolite transporter (DMT)-like permease
VSNRGIARARIFLGGLILFAAAIAWATSLMMSPHGEKSSMGLEHVRTTIVVFLRNSSIGTLILCALAGWLLFPKRRPRAPRRDWAIIALIAVMVLTSLYQLFWLQIAVVH